MATDLIRKTAPITVDTGTPTVILTLPVGKASHLAVHIAVTTQALSDVGITGKAHEGATDIDFTPADWGTVVAGEKVKYTSADIDVIAAAAEQYFDMDVTGLSSVEISAVAAVDGAIVTVMHSLR